MYSAHFHLLLNHWPIIGTFVGLCLFVVSLIANQDDLKQTSLAVFSFLSLLSIPAYMSGNAAQQVIKDFPGVSAEMIQSHQGAALLSLIIMEITGGFALIGLWQFSRVDKGGGKPILPGWNVFAVLILAVATMACMAITGNTGGEIRHPEVVSGTSSALGALGGKILPSIQYVVVDYSMWVWPILEDLHFIGLILIIGAIGVVNLRVMGFLKQLPVAPLHRFIPWGIAGFVINIVSGVLFFIGMPDFYTNNIDFQIKMLAMVLAGSNLLFFHCTSYFRVCARLGPGDEAPALAKFVAASSIFLWIALIVLGRYMPFFEVAN